MSQWRLTVLLAMLVIICAFAVKMLFHPEGILLLAVEFAELAGLLVWLLDFLVNFSRAGDKPRFVRENWFELALFIPFSFMFEAFRVYEVLEVAGIRAFPFIMRTQVLVTSGHIMTQLNRSEPVLFARRTCVEIVSAPDRYRTMRYRGLLNFY